MDIKTQINTIIFSFLYGVFFSIMLGLNYKYIIGSKKILGIIVTFLFIMVNVLLYFIILRKINFGIFHQYEVLFIVLGFIVQNILSKFIKCKIKHKT